MAHTSRKQHRQQQADRRPADRRGRRTPATAISTSPHRRARRADSRTADCLDGGRDDRGGGRTNRRTYNSIDDDSNSDVSNVDSGSIRSHAGCDSCDGTRTSEGGSSGGGGGGDGGGGAFVGHRVWRGPGGGDGGGGGGH
ncbi:unnamed protein product, partial [Scytosiphon promiscuus]